MTVYNDPVATPHQRRTPAVLVAAAWLVVSVPAAWGVYQTAKKSVALFRPATAQTAQTPSR